MHNDHSPEGSADRLDGFDDDRIPAPEIRTCIQEAEQALDRLRDRRLQSKIEEDENTSRLIGAIYALQHKLQRNPQERARFFNDRGAAPSGLSDNPYLPAVKAIVASQRSPALMTAYAQAMLLMERAGVPADAEAAFRWMQTPHGNGGRRREGRTGLAKTKRLWTETLEGKAKQAKKQPSTQQKPQEFVDQAIAEAKATPLVTAAPCPATQAYAGQRIVGLLDVDQAGTVALLKVLTQDDQITEKVLKVCKSDPGDRLSNTESSEK